MVVEVLSPDDEAYDKFAHFAEFGVAEVMVVDPDGRSVRLFRRRKAELAPSPQGEGPRDRLDPFTETPFSELLGLEVAGLSARLDWI